MHRSVTTIGRRLVVESLESRSLMTANLSGMWPLPNPGPTTSLFVRFADNVTTTQRVADLDPLGASVATVYPDGPDLITVGDGVTIAGAVRQLQADPGVIYASADSTIHASAVSGLPNDTAFSQLWGLNNSNNVDIDAPEAWGVTTGNPSTIVAVVDTGIDLNNPDFAGKIWTNTVDDTAAGYPGDVHGWNFINNTSDVQDDDGHGTHVSAIIAAIGNNNDGVVGVDPNAQIMPLKFLDANGNGSTDAAVSAIYFAVNHGAQVINASWGGVDYSGPLGDAIAFANAHNVVFVTAAGNDGTNNNVVPSYPANYLAANELSVASVDRNGNLPSFSNYGSGTVNLAAPGVDIVSDVPTSIDPSGFETLSGTSMSTAYVSGVAALVAGLNPTFTAAQIVQRLDTTTKALPSLAGKTISGGMVDAYNAVTDNGLYPTGQSPPVAGLPILGPVSSTDTEVHAAILGSDEFFADHGGTATGFITGVYLDALGRSPDGAGLADWVGIYNSGLATRFEIADAILTSPEARVTEVARWFQEDLGRSTSLNDLKADPGINGWATLLVDGVGENTVQAAIMSSPEYLIGHGAAPLPVVAGYYQDLTDRTPDATSQSAWAGLLYEGEAPNVVVRYFQGTAEVEQTKVAGWFKTDLGRSATIAQLKADPGVQAWAATLGNF